MSIFQQYYDLSSDENDSLASGSSCSSVEEDDADKVHRKSNTKNNKKAVNHSFGPWPRSILHIDVDCFYVQCEELDRGWKQQQRPLAIGQKHIVVTCNYVARSRGVKKLMSKTNALLQCPDLCIVDGSDLRDYREHSRKVYNAFRIAVQKELGSQLTSWIRPTSTVEELLPCKRNAMDEMIADLSAIVDKLVDIESENSNTSTATSNLISRLKQSNGMTSTRQQESPKIFIFGEDAKSSKVDIVEDQSGASSEIVFGANYQCNSSHNTDQSLAACRRNFHQDTAFSIHRAECRKRMEIATCLAQWICESIQHRTGFHVSAGISISPMLSKLSVLRKPNTVNVLLPWRSPDILYPMPLRKMNDIGSRTYKALVRTIGLEQNDSNLNVRNLLRVPRDTIVEALMSMDQHSTRTNDKRSACEQICDTILNRCRGIDETLVEDDGGGLTKTVSVENSFRRGTLTTQESAQDALSELCRRLPHLVKDRMAWSKHPSMAYPTTIRLTIRTISSHDGRSMTRSKQLGMGTARGKLVLQQERAVKMLRDFTSSIFPQLLSTENINITRMNLAVTNFEDVRIPAQRHPTGSPSEYRHFGSTPSFSQNSKRFDARDTEHGIHSVKKSYTKVVPNETTRDRSRLSSKRKSLALQQTPQGARKFSRTRIDQFFAKKSR